VSMFRHGGTRTRKLLERLGRRGPLGPDARKGWDERIRKELFIQRAIVFTDTADFTTRTARDGILHFLMLFDRTVRALEPVVTRHAGDVVKVDGDSMLLRFLDVPSACRAIVDMEAALRRQNRTVTRRDAVRFSYGVGWGEVLDLEEDVFGLEVNLASKLGEDLAEPGEALLTPAAVAALDEETLGRVAPYTVVTYSGAPLPVHELRLRRRSARLAPVRRPVR
jgi:adenylate cyclase